MGATDDDDLAGDDLWEEDVEYEPVENALDFLESAADLLGGDPTRRDLKYAVLHLYAGVEVLAKARLTRHDWREVVMPRQRDMITAERFALGDFKSVSAEDALDRLSELGLSPLNADDLGAIEQLKALRNRLQHYGLRESAVALKARAARVLSAALSLANSGFEPDEFTVEEAALLGKVRAAADRFADFVRGHWHAVNSRLDPALPVVECITCGEVGVQVGADASPVRCAFCGRRYPPGEELVDEYVWAFHRTDHYLSIKDGDELPVHCCPSCLEDSLVADLPARELTDPGYVCLACGYTAEQSEMRRCAECNEVVHTKHGEIVCNDCFGRWAYAE